MDDHQDVCCPSGHTAAIELKGEHDFRSGATAPGGAGVSLADLEGSWLIYWCESCQTFFSIKRS